MMLTTHFHLALSLVRMSGAVPPLSLPSLGRTGTNLFIFGTFDTFLNVKYYLDSACFKLC